MSNDSEYEQSPEITEQAERVPIVDLEPLPPELPPPPSPLEDECIPIPESTNMDDKIEILKYFQPYSEATQRHFSLKDVFEEHASSSFPVYAIIPVVLSVFGLLLLMMCGFFGYQYWQSVQASENKMQSLNQWMESLQNKTEKFLQALKVLDQNKGDGCGPSVNPLVQNRDHCYHQTIEMVSWLQCFDICISLNATFLKTENSRLRNIMKLLSENHAWLGLSYKKEENSWKWEDGSSPSPDLGLPEPSVGFKLKCVHLNAYSIGADNCTKPFSCICEKADCAINSEEGD